jgi:hypothetical protein
MCHLDLIDNWSNFIHANYREKIKLPIGKDGRFTFVMLFVPRKCHAVFTTDAPQTKYDQIKMKVDYM